MNITRTIPQIAFCCRRICRSQVLYRIAACAILAAMLSVPQFATATTVHMVITTNTTTLGTIDIALDDNQAPITVANFLRYAGRGDYNKTAIHRHATISYDGLAVIQGGGYSIVPPSYLYYFPKDPPIQNEFSPFRPNNLGTIAMAKLGNNPNSATSEWYINLVNNPTLDNTANNGGYTVFGSVVSGMNTVGTIANFSTQAANMQVITQGTIISQLFSELPLVDPTIGPDVSNLVTVSSIPNVTATKTSVTGTTSAYAADVDVTLSNPYGKQTVNTATSTSWLQSFTPPPGKTVQFNDEISEFTMTWHANSPTTRIVTLYHGAATSVNGYYAYGPTASDPSPHWYDFSYDATTGTGAEFVGNQILLHFVDGQRGDNDSIANSVTHIGAPVLITDTPAVPTTSAGCSIATTPAQMHGNGDWIVVSMFLAFVALVRRRARQR